MGRFAVLLALVLTAIPALAQLRPPVPVPRAILNQNLVIEDRGARLEVLPAVRATPAMDPATGRVRQFVNKSAATSRIDQRHLGVVFNHTMQQQGYVTGEIAFMMKAGHTPTGDRSVYPGLRKLTASGLYEVVAHTPAQFVAVTKALQRRSDIAWVEPIVIYGASGGTSAAQ
ncbi:MAG: hypothetical protein ACREVO_14875 [Steroidobacteraceae bacterium]